MYRPRFKEQHEIQLLDWLISRIFCPLNWAPLNQPIKTHRKRYFVIFFATFLALDCQTEFSSSTILLMYNGTKLKISFEIKQPLIYVGGPFLKTQQLKVN